MQSESNARSFRRIHIEKEEKSQAREVRAICYARFSTGNQLNTSIDDQLLAIHQSIQAGEVKSLLHPDAKIVVVNEFSDDAVSGFSMVGRAGLEAALSLIRSRKAQLLLVHDFKRMIRGMTLAISLYEELREVGAELYATSDGFSSAMPDARLAFMHKAFSSEEFIEQISRDTRRGLNARRTQGFSDGHLWYGVTSRPTRQIDTKGRIRASYFDYELVPENAETVRRIFKFASDGLSQKDIAKKLTSEGVPPPSAYDRSGKLKEKFAGSLRWRDRTIHQILHNEAYLGIIKRNKTRQIKRADGSKYVIDNPESQWIVGERLDLKIISNELWTSVRERYAEFNRRKLQTVGNKGILRYEGRSTHPLTSLFKCGECGGSIVVRTNRRGGYYGCVSKHKGYGCQNSKMIRWDKIEPQVLGWITSQLSNDSICAALARRYNELRKIRSSGDFCDLEEKEARLAEVNISIDGLVTAIERGAKSENLFARLSSLETEQKALNERIRFLRGSDKSEIYITASAIKERFRDLPRLLLQAGSYETNRALKPMFAKGGGAVLQKRLDPDGSERYWAVGTLDVGLALGLGDPLGAASVVVSEPVALELPLS